MAEQTLSLMLQGLAGLDKSVRQLAVSNAIKGANEQVDALNQQMTDETQKMQGLRSIAQKLTMHLSGLGADDQTIDRVGKAIAPPQPLIQSTDQALYMGNAEQKAAAQKRIDDEHAFKMGYLKLQREGQETEAKQKRLDKYVGTEFPKNNKAFIEAWQTAQMAPEDLANNAVMQSNLRAMIRQSGDTRISKEDIADFNLDPSKEAEVRRLYAKWVNGESLPDDRTMMTAILTAASRKTNKRIKTNITAFAKKTAGRVGLSPEEMEDEIYSRHFGGSDNFKMGTAEGKAGNPAAPFSLNMNDPNVKKALDRGVSPEEIAAYLQERSKSGTK